MPTDVSSLIGRQHAGFLNYALWHCSVDMTCKYHCLVRLILFRSGNSFKSLVLAGDFLFDHLDIASKLLELAEGLLLVCLQSLAILTAQKVTQGYINALPFTNIGVFIVDGITQLV